QWASHAEPGHDDPPIRPVASHSSNGCPWIVRRGARKNPTPNKKGSPVAGRLPWTADGRASLRLLILDVLYHIADGCEFFSLFIRNFIPEFLFKGHYELNCVERIGAKILDEFCFGCDLIGVHAELFDDDILDSLLDGFFSH